MTPVKGMDHNLVWHFIDEENYYQLHFNMEEAWLTRFKDGQVAVSAGTEYRLVRGQAHDVEVQETSGTIEVRVNGELILEVADETSDEESQGSFGLKLAPGVVAPVVTRFADFQFPTDESSDEGTGNVLLPVPYLRQIDPLWKDVEYDRAQGWSSVPTIGRWGCALTSLTMLLQYYGFDMMPNGEPLRPDTLNKWLVDQPDGYVGQGLVNWWAAARLSRILSDQYTTPQRKLPVLEFSFQGVPWDETALAQLALEQPMIVQVPGHFALIHGYETSTNDFFIADPLFDFDRLSEHEAALSLRVFTPSHTDLSAFVVTHPANTSVTISDSAGGPISQTWQEWVEADDSNERSEKWQFTAVSQPTDGEYTVAWEGASSEDISLLVYDQIGEVAVSETLSSNSGPLLFSFSKTGDTQLYSVFSWEHFLTELAHWYAQRLLPPALFHRLASLSNVGKLAHLTAWPRYKNFLLAILEQYGPEIPKEPVEALRALLQ